MLRTLYGDHDRFIETYWDKFGRDVYFVGDAARKDDDGYFWVIGRVDDVLNVSGHRMSTAEIESAIVSHAKVAEAAVIGQQDEDTGQSVAAFVTLEGDHEGSDELVEEIRDHVAKRIGKLARPKRIIWADDLPKTRSGKIMRRLLRDIAEGRELGDVTTLRDPDVMAAARGQGQGAPGGRGVTATARSAARAAEAVPAVLVGLQRELERRLEVVRAEQVDERALLLERQRRLDVVAGEVVDGDDRGARPSRSGGRRPRARAAPAR